MKPYSSWTWFVILLVGLISAGCIPQRTPPANLDTVTLDGRPILHIGVDENLPPFAQPGADPASPVGFEIDLMRAVIPSSKYEIEFVPSDSTQILAFVSQCQLDAGIAALTITDLLKKSMDFSDPYYTTGQVVVVKEGNILITSKDDLAGMKVGTQDNTPSEVALDAIPGVQKLEYASFNLAIRDLTNGYIDAVVVDYPRALGFVAVKRNNLKVVGEEFGQVDYGIAVCKDRPDQTALLDDINAGLEIARNSGRLDRLVKKWGIKELLAASR